MNEKDYKHVNLILVNIKLYRNNKISLFELVQNIDALIGNLEQIDNVKKNDLQEYCGTLEVVYAVNLQENSGESKELSIQDNKIINKTLKKIEQINYEILDNLKKTNSSIKEEAEIIDQEWLLCPVCHDAWQSHSLDAMIVCANCQKILHNPRSKK